MTDWPSLACSISSLEAVTWARVIVITYGTFRINIIHCANLLCASHHSCSLDGYAIAETRAFAIDNAWYEYVASNSVQLCGFDDGVIRLHSLGTSQFTCNSKYNSASEGHGQVEQRSTYQFHHPMWRFRPLLQLKQPLFIIPHLPINRHTSMLAEDLRARGMQEMHILARLLLHFAECLDQEELVCRVQCVDEEEDD